MDEIVRVGLVGTSWFADGFHLPLIKSHAQAQVAAICGRNPARAQELADKYSIPRVFTDYREMLTRDLLDAVVIAVPDDMHYPITMAALEADVHVLVEKPMAMNLVQAREMAALAKAKAQEARVKTMLNFTWRWSPWVRTLQKLVSEGYLGQIYDVQVEYFSGYARDDYYQWKWDRAHGLGALGDLGSHAIDFALLLVGPICGVQARLCKRIPRKHPDGLPFAQANDSASLLVDFTNGACGSIFISTVAQSGTDQVQRIQLSGSEGTLEMVANNLGYWVRGLRQGEERFQTFPVPAEFLPDAPLEGRDALVNIFSHQSVGPRLFIDSIQQDFSPVPSFAEGVNTMAVIDAAFQSDAEGQRVAVEE
jgi:predicted dehydrogenase